MFGFGLGGEVNGHPSGAPLPTDLTFVKDDNVVCPSDMICIGDCTMTEFAMQPPVYIASPILGNPIEEILRSLGASIPGADAFPDVVAASRKRHNDRWNMAFCDGHIEAF